MAIFITGFEHPPIILRTLGKYMKDIYCMTENVQKKCPIIVWKDVANLKYAIRMGPNQAYTLTGAHE